MNEKRGGKRYNYKAVCDKQVVFNNFLFKIISVRIFFSFNDYFFQKCCEKFGKVNSLQKSFIIFFRAVRGVFEKFPCILIPLDFSRVIRIF